MTAYRYERDVTQLGASRGHVSGRVRSSSLLNREGAKKLFDGKTMDQKTIAGRKRTKDVACLLEKNLCEAGNLTNFSVWEKPDKPEWHYYIDVYGYQGLLVRIILRNNTDSASRMRQEIHCGGTATSTNSCESVDDIVAFLFKRVERLLTPFPGPVVKVANLIDLSDDPQADPLVAVRAAGDSTDAGAERLGPLAHLL